MAQGGVAAAHPVPSSRRGGQSGRRRPSMALDRTQHRDDQVRIYAEAQRRRCLRQRQRKRGAVGGRRARRGPPHGQHGARPAPPPHQPVGEPPGGPRESGLLRVVAGAVPENGAHQVRRVRSFTLRAAPARPHPPSSQRCPTPQLPEWRRRTSCRSAGVPFRAQRLRPYLPSRPARTWCWHRVSHVSCRRKRAARQSAHP